MNIEQRLEWAERPEGIACFVEGSFVRFYQGQLAWYCQQVKPIKVCTRAVKKLAGQQIYYGGVPKGLFDGWLAQQAEGQWCITHHPWGVWLVLSAPLDIPALLAWCAAHAAPPLAHRPSPRLHQLHPLLMWPRRHAMPATRCCSSCAHCRWPISPRCRHCSGYISGNGNCS